jgi:hypothetical protein
LLRCRNPAGTVRGESPMTVDRGGGRRWGGAATDDEDTGGMTYVRVNICAEGALMDTFGRD